MTPGRDARTGRFLPGNAYRFEPGEESSRHGMDGAQARNAKLTPEQRAEISRRGGQARAQILTPEERSAISAQGFYTLAERHFGGDKVACKEWMGRNGAYAADRPYRQIGWGVIPPPPPLPDE